MRLFITFLLLALSSSSFALLPQEKVIQKIYKKVVPSVVHITNIQKIGGFFKSSKDVPAGTGSGFVWDRQGHIITNFHVVDGAKELEVLFHNDDTKYKAKLIGTARRKDIAVIKLIDKPRYLKPISIGRSDNLNVGQYSIAIGNPFGLKHSMSMGIISALGRSIEGVAGVDIQNMIQTDAAINLGNSGGPLLNSDGKLIGMNTMIFSSSGSNAGLGFSVPVDTINLTAPNLIEHGEDIFPVLGIAILEEHITRRFLNSKGVGIRDIAINGPARNIGIQTAQVSRNKRNIKADVILEIEGQSVDSLNDINRVLNSKSIGDYVKVVYQRGTRLKEASLRLAQSNKMRYSQER